MKKNLSSGWLLLIIAFITACLLWYVVIKEENPMTTVDLGRIPVSFANLEEAHNKGYAVYIETNNTINVKVRVPQQRGWLISADCIRLYSDMKNFSPNVEGYPVYAEVVSQRTLIGENYELAKSMITVSYDKLEDKTLPVDITITGSPASGFEVGECQIESSTLEVKIPRNLYDLPVSASATIDVSGRSQDFSQYVRLQLFDAEGNTIDYDTNQITAQAKDISVYVPVNTSKTVTLSSGLIHGTPDDNYDVTGVTVDPEEITLVGSEEALSGLNQIILQPDELDVTGKSETYTISENIRKYLPEDVYLAYGTSGTAKITVDLEQKASKTFSLKTNQIVVENVAEGLQASIPEEVFQIAVKGLREDVVSLSSRSLTMTIDMTGMPAGTYTRQIIFGFTDSSRAEKYDIGAVKYVTVTLSDDS